MAMGEDGDTLSSSNFNKPSPVNEEVKNLNCEASQNIAEQCQFIHKADNLNESPFDSKENEAVPLMDKFETQPVAEAGMIGTEGIHGELLAGEATVVDTRIGEEAALAGERLLSGRGDLHGGLVPEDGTSQEETKALLDRRGGEEIDSKIGGEPAAGADKPGAETETPASGGGKSISFVGDHQLAGAETVFAAGGAIAVTNKVTVDQQVAPTVNGGEKIVSDIDISGLASAESADVDEVFVTDALESGSGSVLAEGENSVSEVKTLMLGSVTDEGVGKEAVVTEESSAVVMGTEKAESAIGELEKSAPRLDHRCSSRVEPVADKDLIAEELSETKVDPEKAEKVAKATEGEHDNIGSAVSQLVEAPLIGIQEKERESCAEVESLPADPKMEDEVSMPLESSNMQIDGSGIAAKGEENGEMLSLEGIPTLDTKAEMGMETETETNGCNEGESLIPTLDDLQVLPQDEEDEEIVAEEGTTLADTEMETETEAGDSGRPVGGKRKRGKNSKTSGSSKVTSRAGKIMEEDVCFICFDGGDLVLCDRRGCPKAYHPSCVNRDEAFFRSKGRWNCGWHLCSICEKNAHYMCYTCTFSLCKGCIRNAVILCVRGNKGFCETCMRTVKLIENNDLGNKDGQIDFDDKSSWEFLFKDYYVDLKSKLSLSSVEIAEAKNPWKGSGILAGKEDLPEAPVGSGNGGGSGSENSTENPEANKLKRRKAKKRLRSHVKEKDSSDMAASIGGECNSISTTPGNAEWASKELLEFVMHMKNGDKSVLTQFDVQALLLEYIKRNKLRDPRKKSQIICDSRLRNLFGKPRVGHFEMLKLLESHFLIKEDSQTDDVQGSVVDTDVNQLEANENADNPTKDADTPTKEIKDRKRKTRKKGDGSKSQSDRYEYAAIDVHNIGLIYLRRKLMEDLLEDVDEFQNKVVGTFVRIRISGSTQKQDLYRLVQVVGTSRVAEPYKVGKRTTDMMLEILNLNKTEVVSIDTISNQDFTEEECKRLRQSIKCGLLNRMTVGDILDKAMEIQTARVNDWLESETARLSHLRDRASDMGRRKELRECVEKLEILKAPEERLRRLEEVPQIHADPNMDPNHESDEDPSETDDNRREAFMRSRISAFSRRGRAPMSPGSDFSSKDSWNAGKTSTKNWELDTNFSSKNLLNSVEDTIQSNQAAKENASNQGIERETPESDNLLKFSASSKADKVGWSNQSVVRSESASAVMVNPSVSILAKEVLSGVGSVNSSASLSAKEAETAVKINETQKMWHYQDPSGKVQGPFSMVQLRKWSNTGYFPPDLKIWRTSESQDESILLTDALAGRFQKEVPIVDGAVSMSASLQSPHVLSGHSGKISEKSLQLQQARQDQLEEKSNVDQNPGAKTLHLGISKGSMGPSVEVAKLSAEKCTRTDAVNLPSPTPKHGNAGGHGEGVPLTSGTMYPGGIQSATAAFAEHRKLSSVSASTEQLTKGLEIAWVANTENTAIGSGVSLQISSLAASGEPQAVDKPNHLPHDNSGIAIQPVNIQNPRIETHGWGGPPTQKLETNPSVGQPQAYNPWGAVASTILNPAGGFPDSAASALPQTEFWRPPAQINQANMQPAGGPNLAWGAGLVDSNSSTPVLRPENSNADWATIQGAPNVGWGGPVSGATNMNWGATVQGPVPGNANSGWSMAPVNMGTTIQGPMPGNVNPGWVAPTGNPGVQGLGPGGSHSGWVAPAGNMGSAIVPGPGNGWNLQPGNPGAPVQAPSAGNPTHGWGAPAGNQGLWGSEQHQSGSKFSGQRDKGSQGGDSGFGGGRPWNGQPSFGNNGSGGPSRHLSKRQTLCPYNINGRCKKGAACDYLHA